MNVLFVTEGGGKLGMGHITRCFSLYTAFKQQNIQGEFIINGDATVNAPYKQHNWQLFPEQLISDIAKADIVILDSIEASDSVVKLIMDKSKLPVFIDDYKRLTYNRGVVIDWTPFVEKKNAHAIIPTCTYLLGNEYIALRKSFWEIPQKNINEQVSEILITMGGGDLRNLCPKILRLVIKVMPCEVRKKVMVGAAFAKENVAELKNIQEQNKSVELIFSPSEEKIIELFLNADVVISAGGQTLYELARVGTPTIGVLIIDNQKYDMEGWEDAGFIGESISWDDLNFEYKVRTQLSELCANVEVRKSKSKIGQALVDGMGPQRIVEIILKKIEKDEIV